MSLILIGFFCAGKTTIGKKCASLLNLPFFDADHVLEEKEKKKVGRLYSELKEDKFRVLENDILKNSIPKSKIVLSTGGGVVCREDNLLLLKERGTIIYLKAAFSTLLPRVLQRNFPMFAQREEHLELVAEKRFPIYEKWADCIVETDNLSVDQSVELVCNMYGK
jgi:shikimate kinase